MSQAIQRYEIHKYFTHIVIANSFITDPITRERLNIMLQTVALTVAEGDSKVQLMQRTEEMDKKIELAITRRRVNSVARGLGGWDRVRKRKRRGSIKPSGLTDALKILLPGAEAGAEAGAGPAGRRGGEQVAADGDLRIVVLGAAAAGKSCLLKRVLVMCAQRYSGAKDDLVPVLILLIDLGRVMARHSPEPLTADDDLIEEYLKDKYGAESNRFKVLKKAVAEGRALLLLDGLDEAGDQKNHIERWIERTVNANSRQRLIVSSRHSGFKEEVFSEFKFIQVQPLDRASQNEIVKLRLPNDAGAAAFVQRELARRAEYMEMASNPLMLSLLISILRRKFADKQREHRPGSGKRTPRSFSYTRAKLYSIGIQPVKILQNTFSDRTH